MIEIQTAVRTPDGSTEAFLFKPEDGSRKPGVLFLTDIMGIRDANRGMARRVAEKGYTVLMPNIFYRTSTLPVLSFQPNFGDERTTKRFEELRGPMTPDVVERDGSAYVDFLTAQDSVSNAPIGAVGYCYSGAMTMRTAAARPQRVGAVASFHGGGLCTDASASPHLLLPRIKARLYFGHAANDRSMPAEAIEKFEKALAAWGGEYESETYEGALHGWTVPGGPVYNEPQAERAFAKLIELFAATLK